MWRQGDILIEQVASIPEALPQIRRLVLAAGDSTGHRHQIKERKGVQLFGQPDGDMYLAIEAEQATIVHPEHGPISLKAGNYRVWKQREFSDGQARPVFD